jgi:hypothetical protein
MCCGKHLYVIKEKFEKKEKKSSKLYKKLVMKIIKPTPEKKMDSNVKYMMEATKVCWKLH